MKIIVETPKGSFRKMKRRGEEYNVEFFSPIPTPFNYGYIEGTLGEDGMPLDVIIPGEKIKSGSTLNLSITGTVCFVDDGKKDNKYIASADKKSHERWIFVFFKLYAYSKLLIGLLKYRRWTKNQFKGITWFEKEIQSPGDLEREIKT